MTGFYRHLAPYSDLVNAAARFVVRPPENRLTPGMVRTLIGFDGDGEPADARLEARWSRDGIDAAQVPRTAEREPPELRQARRVGRMR